ncbi:MAG: 4Fe-4S dicluster domain-containing protein, partial [Epsilonproteobacteria bacterium]|nr:4Fe-4S dicluster domain-containing protein [Campylobacterota bacterium]
LAHQRLEGYNLFNNVTHLDTLGDPHHSVLDRFLTPIFGHEHLDNTGFASMQGNIEEKEGGHQ